MCLYCIGKVSICSIKSCGRSWSAHEGTIYAYTKALLRKNCLSSHSCHFVKNYFFLNQTPSCICSMCLHCIGKVSTSSIKSCGRSWSAHEGTIYAYTKALLGKNCLSSHSCHFVKNYFFLNQTPSCICSMCLHCIGKVSTSSIKSCGRSWSAHEGTIYAYTNTLLGKKCRSSHCCHFVKDYFFLNQTPSCICSMCLHCIGKVSYCSIKSCGRSWSADDGTIYAYTKALLGKNCLSSHSCHFVKKHFF